MRQVRAISRPRFGLRYVLGLAVLVVACERSPDTPAGPSAMLQAGGIREDAPFYYYHGRPIYLEVDPQVVMISTTEPSPQLAIADALRHEGLAVSAVDQMRNRSDHWTVRLPALNREAAQALVERLRRSGRFAFVENAFRLPGLDMPPARPVNRLSVRFKPGVSRAAADSLAQTFGLQLLRPANPDSAYYTYQFAYPRTEAPLRVAQRVYRHPLVEWAEPGLAGVVRREQARTDPYYAEQFHLRNTVTKYSVPVDINIEPAWALGPGGSTVFLAVLDDGVDLNHPDLACKLWSSFGFDLFPNHPDHVFNPSAYGGNGDLHGTAVAGVIFSCNDNGIGIAGIAPEIAMVAVRIIREDEAEPLDAAHGIDLAWMYGAADVINNSWTVAAPSQEVEDAIARAASLGRGGLGTVVVQAAGNWTSPLARSQGYYLPPKFPSQLPNVVSVSAITRYGEAADFAPRGPEIDIVAPSDNVGVICSGDFVTLDLRVAGCNDGPPDGHNSLYSRSFGGTSAAAPQVSAVAAMLLSRHPTLSREQVVSRLLTNAVYWGRSDDFGFGKLDAYRVLTGASLPPLPVGLDGTDIAHPLQQCTWSAAATGGTEPYTYYWTVDGTAVGDGSETLRYTAGYADFVVRVQVNDASGRFGQASRSVRVDGSGQGCLEQ